VILELGYFVGRLGRSRVCALYKPKIELPSDFLGVIYVPFDEGGGWQLILARELKNAGFSIDMNEVI
jgi:predicted nucleotide-binding protein